MRLLTFTLPGIANPRLGALSGGTVLDLQASRTWGQEFRSLPSVNFPASMFELISSGSEALAEVQRVIDLLKDTDPLNLQTSARERVGYRLDEIRLRTPLPRAMSLRDFYAFEQHVATAFGNRDRAVPQEWYRFPVFYFSNPNALFGPGEVIPYPPYTSALDYELEVACIIGKPGMDISPEQATEHIFGYTILNDWSARDIQKEEMRVGLGPAKGKDFASSLGPWITTPDELADCSTGRSGVYDLSMTARVNGIECSRGNWRDLHYSFGEMIARASQGVYLLPGEVLGSGTVGSGCLLELTRGRGPWLARGDRVELEIERLGVLANRVA